MNASRLTEALADRYRIERELGQGGMRGDTVYALPVVAGESRGREAPRALFSTPEAKGSLDDFDVTADGQRFLIRLPNTEAYARGIDIVMNWFTVLRTRPPGGKQ